MHRGSVDFLDDNQYLSVAAREADGGHERARIRIAVEEKAAAVLVDHSDVLFDGLSLDPVDAKVLIIAIISAGGALSSAWYRGEVAISLDDLARFTDMVAKLVRADVFDSRAD